MYVYVSFLPASVCAMYMSVAFRGQKRASEPLELELGMVGNHWPWNLSPPQEQQVFVTAGPSLQLLVLQFIITMLVLLFLPGMRV